MGGRKGETENRRSLCISVQGGVGQEVVKENTTTKREPGSLKTGRERSDLAQEAETGCIVTTRGTTAAGQGRGTAGDSVVGQGRETTGDNAFNQEKGTGIVTDRHLRVL